MRKALLAIPLALLLSAPALAGADPLRSGQWGLDRVGAESAWPVARGRGMMIAVVDTGVDLTHEDLRGRLVPGRDFVDGDDRPQDERGHGTHVAGIAAAATGNDRGVAGVAPGARIMPVRVLDEDGRGTSAAVAAGIRWAVDRGAQVVNLSLGDLGQPLFGPAFSSALDYAWSRGSIPVVAAGNEFLLSSGYESEPALVVSATDRADRKPAYSSGVGAARWGMAAPGGAGDPVGAREDDILSTHWARGESNRYAYLAGTSMAAPHVAAAAAILRSAGLTPEQTVDRLLSTAEDLGRAGRDPTFGAGRLDLAAAARGLAPTAARAEKSEGSGATGTAPRPSGEAPAPERSTATEDAPDPRETVSPPAASEESDGRPSEEPSPDRPGIAAGESPPEGSGGLPLAPVATGLLVLAVAAVVAWTLFRPGPEG